MPVKINPDRQTRGLLPMARDCERSLRTETIYRGSEPRIGREERKHLCISLGTDLDSGGIPFERELGLLWLQVEKRLLKLDRYHSLGLAFSTWLNKATANTCAHNFPGSLLP